MSQETGLTKEECQYGKNYTGTMAQHVNGLTDPNGGGLMENDIEQMAQHVNGLTDPNNGGLMENDIEQMAQQSNTMMDPNNGGLMENNSLKKNSIDGKNSMEDETTTHQHNQCQKEVIKRTCEYRCNTPVDPVRDL